MSMSENEIKKTIRNMTVKAFMKEYGVTYIPVAISNRHVHLSANDLELLFGKGYCLKKIRDLSQPGQFVCEEKVSLVTTKGTLSGIRVLGPVRKETQVEISVTDSYIYGIKPVIRMSGDLEGTPGGKLIGPKGEVMLTKGVIISARHLHVSDEEAKWFGLKNGDIVRAKKEGLREITFERIIVRVGPGHSLELHIDIDEGNAAGIVTGEFLRMEKG